LDTRLITLLLNAEVFAPEPLGRRGSYEQVAA